MNPAELKFVLSNAKKGKYGKVYGRLDGNVIFEWFNSYMDDRISVPLEKKEEGMTNVQVVESIVKHLGKEGIETVTVKATKKETEDEIKRNKLREEIKNIKLPNEDIIQE